MNTQYRIAWEVISTGIKGHGEWLDSLETAQDWVGQLNADHSNIFHWTEASTDDPN